MPKGRSLVNDEAEPAKGCNCAKLAPAAYLDLLNDSRCKVAALSIMLRRLLEEGSVPCDDIQMGIMGFFDDIEEGIKEAEAGLEMHLRNKCLTSQRA